MAEHVEVVIKIPKYYLTHPQDYTCLAECVRRGTVLPKGHKRLIDAEELSYNAETCIETTDAFIDLINKAPTIIEADKCTYKETGCGSCKRQLDCPIEAEGSESE